MTRALIILFVFTLLTASVRAQKVNYQRSVGIKSIGVGATLLPGSYGANLSFNNKIAYQVYYQLGGIYFEGTSGYTKFRVYNIQNQFSYELFNLNNVFSCSTGGAFNIGIEDLLSTVNNSSRKQKFIHGLGLDLGADLSLGKRLGYYVQGSVNKRYRSEIYNWNLMLLTGIKIIII